MKPLRVAGLFSGIGGFELGLHQAGHESALLCELDEGARTILRKHFRDVNIEPDVRRLRTLPCDADVLVAGFPCQDLSSVGRATGIEGAKSSLIKEVFRLLRARPIPRVIIENVPFMLKLHRGAAINYVTSKLEQLGYRWAYRVLDSRAFGVPQRRKRVFIFAALDSDPRVALLTKSQSTTESAFALDQAAHGFYWTEGNRGVGWAENAVPALKGGSSVFISSPPAILLRDGRLVVPTVEACERLQGFPSGWTKPAAAAGFGRRRNAYIGNAVTVGVARWLGEQLGVRGTYDDTDDAPLQSEAPWPQAAWYDGRQRGIAKVTDWPKRPTTWDLEEFLRGRHLPLSIRAAAGFLSRLKASRLRVPLGFHAALEAHVRKGNSKTEPTSVVSESPAERAPSHAPVSSE